MLTLTYAISKPEIAYFTQIHMYYLFYSLASRSASVCSLEKANDASRSLLLQSFTTSSKTVKTTSATLAIPDDSAAILSEQDEFFVGSFRDYAKLAPPRLLRLQEAALGIDAPLPTGRRRFSDVRSNQSSEIEHDVGEFSDDDEIFSLDL